MKKILFDVEASFGIGNSTYAASYLFAGLTNCTTVVIPSDVKVYTYGANMFNGCTKLITFGPEGTPEETYDLRNVVGSDYGSKNVTNGNIFANCATGANITVLMPYATTLSKSTVPCIGYNYAVTSPTVISNFQNAASVTFKTLPGTVGATVAEAYAKNYDPDETGKWTVVSYVEGEAVKNGTGRNEKTNENWYCDFKYSLDLVTGVLNIEFTSGTKDRFIYSPNSVITNLSKEFGPLITRVNFIGFIQLFENWEGTFLPATMTNLKTVDIGTINDFRHGSTSTVWFNSPTLTTFGSSARGT